MGGVNWGAAEFARLRLWRGRGDFIRFPSESAANAKVG